MIRDREPKSTREAPRREPTAFDIYLEEINKVPLMTREEEREVARRARAGDQRALDQLVQANLRFVVSVAKRYANQGIPIEDLVNDGNLGLIKAAQRFDVDRGYKFISYAVWWIRQSMLLSLSQNSRIVRLPLNRANVLYKIGKISRELDQELGRAPTAEEIAEHIDVPVAEVQETMEIANHHVSLDESLSDSEDDRSFVDYLEDDAVVSPDNHVDQEMLSADLDRVLKTLTERERTIMQMYYGLNGEEPITLEQIGKRLGLTRERIRQIKEHAIQRLRHQSRAKLLEPYFQN
jgi:RNA polymerase primary sigma factor